MKEHKYTRLDTGEENGLATIASEHSLSVTKRRRTQHFFAHFVLILSNLIFAALWLDTHRTARSADCVRPQLTYSPAVEAISYERRRLFRSIAPENVFAGRPRPELDAAWRDIVEPITIKVSGDELARADLGDPTIAFKDGSGYIAEVAVYHELHCIKRIRRAFHLDYYYPDMDANERAREDAHIDHCLEYWREAAMCRADINLGTFFWRKDGPTSRVYTDHECVSWDRLDAWARARMVNMSDLTQFDRPEEMAEIPLFAPGDH